MSGVNPSADTKQSQATSMSSSVRNVVYFKELSPTERAKAIDDFWDELMEIRDRLDSLSRSHPMEEILQAKQVFDDFARRMVGR